MQARPSPSHLCLHQLQLLPDESVPGLRLSQLCLCLPLLAPLSLPVVAMGADLKDAILKEIYVEKSRTTVK